MTGESENRMGNHTASTVSVTSAKPPPQGNPIDEWDGPLFPRPGDLDDDWNKPPRRKTPASVRRGFWFAGGLLLLGFTNILFFQIIGRPAIGVSFWLMLVAFLSWGLSAPVLFWAWERWRDSKGDWLIVEFLSRSFLTSYCSAVAFALFAFLILMCSGAARP